MCVCVYVCARARARVCVCGLYGCCFKILNCRWFCTYNDEERSKVRSCQYVHLERETVREQGVGDGESESE